MLRVPKGVKRRKHWSVFGLCWRYSLNDCQVLIFVLDNSFILKNLCDTSPLKVECRFGLAWGRATWTKCSPPSIAKKHAGTIVKTNIKMMRHNEYGIPRNQCGMIVNWCFRSCTLQQVMKIECQKRWTWPPEPTCGNHWEANSCLKSVLCRVVRKRMRTRPHHALRQFGVLGRREATKKEASR